MTITVFIAVNFIIITTINIAIIMLSPLIGVM